MLAPGIVGGVRWEKTHAGWVWGHADPMSAATVLCACWSIHSYVPEPMASAPSAMKVG